MLGKIFRKLDRTLLLAGLAVQFLAAVALLVWFGWKTGGVLAGLFFVLSDGPGLLYEVLTAGTREAVAREREAAERQKFSDRSSNNPTVR